LDERALKVLTDTHTLVWALSDPGKLSTRARNALSRYPFTASVVNLWELVLKADKPGALLDDPVSWWDRYVDHLHIPTLSIRTAHMRALSTVPAFHRDPFDRVLLAQAVAENLTLITRDDNLALYGVKTIW